VAKILICDDDDMYRQIADAAFAGIGHELTFAMNGDDALALLKAKPIELVITDLVMPGKDGLELIRAMRSARSELPILAMTGGVSSLKEPLLVAASALGADAVIEKPFRPQALRERAVALLAKTRKESAA
jgi:DNA-binding response OmpR family regulator